MFFNIFLILLTLWVTIYSLSYSASLFKGKKIAGGIFLILLSTASVALCFNYVFRLFLI